jgi:methyl-accepting chemotaxis protein
MAKAAGESIGMGIVLRTIVSFVVVATAAGAAVATTAWLRGQHEIDNGIGVRLSQLKSDLNSRIDAEAMRAKSLAMLVAESPEAKLAMEAADRQALLSIFGPMYESVRQSAALDQFQFHVPPATSLLRLHQPAKYGDDLSAIRPMVVEANKSRKPLAGMEMGVAGVGIRGIAPVSKDGRHLGTVEFGATLGDPLLRSFTNVTGAFAAIFISDGGVLKPVGSTLPPRIADDLRQLAQTELAQKGQSLRYWEDESVSYGWSAFTLLDYSGKPVATAVIAADTQAYAAARRETGWFMMMTAFGALVLGSLVGLILARRLIGPMNRLTAAIEALADCRYDVAIPATGRRDEIGMIARALGRLKDHACEIADHESRMTARAWELEAMDRSIRSDIESNLNGIVLAAIETSEGTSRMVRIMDEVAQTGRRSQSMAAAVEEMVASMREISRLSETAAVEATQAGDAAQDGHRSSEVTDAVLGRLFKTVTEAAQRAEGLAEASQRIGGIANEIEGIAGQTNLLALNATIEAARAGEAGKGFAIVAGEVKSLASQTAHATDDVRLRVTEIRTDIAGVVEQMRTGAEAAGQGRSAMVDLMQRLDIIGENVSGVAGRIGEIASILGQQTAAADEVAQSTIAIADLSHRNNEQIHCAMAAMKQTANALNDRVGEMARMGTSTSVLIVAKNDHVMFKTKILEAVLGQIDMREDEVADHTRCRLGNWLSKLSDDQRLIMPSLADMDEPHRVVHEAGREALAAMRGGDREAALAAVDRMNAASRLVIDCLDRALAEWKTAQPATSGGASAAGVVRAAA